MLRNLCFVLAVVMTTALSVSAHDGHRHVRLECKLDKAVDDGKYDWVHEYIKKGKAPEAKCTRNKKVAVELFQFEENPITTDEVIAKMAEVGCRPATWPEFLALGAQYPELQRKDTIVGLGSLWVHEDGTTSAPTLEGDDKERLLKLYPSWMGWENDKYTHWIFAAVCDKDKKK